MAQVTTLLTYHGNVTEKRATLKQLREHRALDQIVQGTYWTGNGEGKGCAVGCLTHSPNGGHEQFPDRWGVPEQLAYLIDQIFESLSPDEAVEWPVRIMSAIPVGADLSRVWDRFAHWMLIRLLPIAGQAHAEVEAMALLFERAAGGDEPDASDWQEAARAAWAAWAAAAARAAWAASRQKWGHDAADELVRLVKATG